MWFAVWCNGTSCEAMTIRACGNVGIGTTAPLAKLEVKGDLFVTKSSTNEGCDAGLRIANTSANGMVAVGCADHFDPPKSQR